MDDITEVAADFVSDNTHNTSLPKFVAGTLMVAGAYFVGKGVGGWRQKRKQRALNTVPVPPVNYIDTTAR